MGNSEGIHRSGKCGGGKEIFKKIHGADNIWTELEECKGIGEDKKPGVRVVVGGDFQVRKTP